MHRFVPILAILALSCGNTARPDFIVHLVGESNNNPFFECLSGSVRVDVQQGTGNVLTSNATITGPGALSSLAVEISSYGLTTQIEVTVQCMHVMRGPITLIGATPHFIPLGYAEVDVVLGEPETCRMLSAPMLVSPRIGPAFVSLHANLVTLGGTETSGAPSTHVQAIDPVSLTAPGVVTEFDQLSMPIGRGDAVALTDTRIVFASDASTAIFDAAPGAATRLIAIDPLHSGARSESALVSLGVGNGVAIVGGYDGNAVDGITWVNASTGMSTRGHLHSARRRPSATLVQATNLLLVVGGQGPGEPLFEIVEIWGDGLVAFDPPTSEQRYAPVVTSDLAHTHAFVALGSDAALGGTVSTTSWVLSSCNVSGCDVAAGPAITDPRSDVVVVEHHAGEVGAASPTDFYETLLIGGTDASGMPSTLIDRVHFDGDVVSVTPGGNLQFPRTSAGAADVGGGIVLVGGGADEHVNALQSLEICFPAALRPISSAE